MNSICKVFPSGTCATLGITPKGKYPPWGIIEGMEFSPGNREGPFREGSRSDGSGREYLTK